MNIFSISKSRIFTGLLSLLLGAFLAMPLFAQKGTVISGRVTDENALPLVGAGVLLPDGKTGVVTDSDGRWSITVPDGENILSFSYIGYETVRIAIDGRKIVDVSMTPDKSTTLNDVVVIGYGTSKKADLTVRG